MGFDLKSWVVGYAMGRAGMPMAFAEKPGMYLFNGHRLPALPLWDRETFPYAFILIPDESLPNSDYAALYILSILPRYENGMVTFEGGVAMRSQISGESQWPEPVETDSSGVVASYVQWTNTDIPARDGSIFLCASAPVPVYGR